MTVSTCEMLNIATADATIIRTDATNSKLELDLSSCSLLNNFPQQPPTSSFSFWTLSSYAPGTEEVNPTATRTTYNEQSDRPDSTVLLNNPVQPPLVEAHFGVDSEKEGFLISTGYLSSSQNVAFSTRPPGGPPSLFASAGQSNDIRPDFPYSVCWRPLEPSDLRPTNLSIHIVDPGIAYGTAGRVTWSTTRVHKRVQNSSSD